MTKGIDSLARELREVVTRCSQLNALKEGSVGGQLGFSLEQ